MNKKLYKMMDWAAVEEIVYAESLHPENILGSHNAGKNSVVQCFFPGAKSVTLLIDEDKKKNVKALAKEPSEIEMDMMDEEGFFAALLSGNNRTDYSYKVVYNDKSVKSRKVQEIYTAVNGLKDSEKDMIFSGSDMKVYEKLGAKVCTRNGKKGTYFAVYAPNALRVSVVGDFNNNDGRAMQMMCDEVNGIFELFVPGVSTGDAYRYEILVRGGVKLLKNDPYTFDTVQKEDGVYSVVSSATSFSWKDEKYIKNLKKSTKDSVLNIYEIDGSAFDESHNLLEICPKVISHMKEFGYTHVSLMPLAEEFNDTHGYKPTFIYALNHRYAKPDELAGFVNKMHEAGLGVILQMQLNSFDDSRHGIAGFDGSCLYEHEDARKGIDPRTGARVFQFGTPYVNQYVEAAVLYWVNTYHLDGIMLTDLSSMLYLDYYRDQWVPNMYGSNENLEAISFIRQLNKLLHEQNPAFITIADEETGWPDVTSTEGQGAVEAENCLNFDYAISKGFNQDVIPYMGLDPYDRSKHHHELTLSTVYQYKENYILAVSHSDIDFGKGGVISRMWGDENSKLSNYKAFVSYLMTHSGKKCFFMGQDEARYDSYDGDYSLEASGEISDNQKKASKYLADLMKFISGHQAFYKYDHNPKGFSWINNFSANENVIVFERKADTAEQNYVVVINFANNGYDKYKIGVPNYGKYNEVINSDSKLYGGEGRVNSKLIVAKEDECDGKKASITLKLAPLSATILEYVPFTQQELDEMERIRKEKEAALLEKKRKQEALRKEKARIRASLKEELERKIREAEEAIENGSELNFKETVKKVAKTTVKKATEKKATLKKATDGKTTNKKVAAKKTDIKKSTEK